MVEKFSDYEGGFIQEEGDFIFTIKSYELKDSSKGTPMAVFEVNSEAGSSTIYHSLNPKARWSYNNLIKACLKLDSRDKIDKFSCDYETIGNDLVDKKFLGTVERQDYDKDVKVPLDDGTFETTKVTKEGYKITKYGIA